MADKTIRESFFDAKAIGSLWDVAVSLKRGNPLPIDADSVFESEAKLIEYIGDKITTVAYPGQVVAVVNADSTQIYYIDQELNYHPVGAKLDADGKSIKVDNNVLKLVGFDEAADGLLAQVKVDAEGNRTLNWVSITEIAKGDGNTTYVFTGKEAESNVYFEVKASDADTAAKIYLDAYTKAEVDAKFEALVDNDTTYTFTNGTEGKFTVTPKNGDAIEVDTGAKAYVDSIIGEKAEGEEDATGIYKAIDDALAEAKKYADDNDANTVYDDTNLSNRVKTLEDAGHQNADQVNSAISTALTDYYNKKAVDDKVDDLNSKISAIPKFAIEVANASGDGTPDVAEPSYTTVYLVPDNDTKTADVYDEYIFVKVSETESNWELLGKQTLDLTGYATENFVTTEIGKLSAEGGAIKVVADDLDLLEQAHNTLADDVETLEGAVADLKAIDHEKVAADAASAAITAHNADKSHLTANDVDNQIDAKLTTADYEGKIATAKQEAIDAAALAVPVKTVDETEFTLTEGKLEVKEIAQSKVTGLADVFANIYTKTETDNKIAEVIGTKPTNTGTEEEPEYTGATGIYVDIYTKNEVTDLISSFTGGESAADVLAELNKYKSSNDARVLAVENVIGKEAEGENPATGIIGDIASITAALDTKLEGVNVNGVPLAVIDNVVDIPAATADVFGAVKLGAEFKTNATSGELEVASLNVNKLVQDEGDFLILDGGLASSLIK